VNDLRGLLRRALMTSGRTQDACVFPTILAEWPKEALERKPDTTRADIAMAYLARYGFKSDRTRMNLDGYPGLFRKLNEPPPWVEETPLDVDDPISTAREKERRPLYLHANEAPVLGLLVHFREHLKAQDSVVRKLGAGLPAEYEQWALEDFQEKLLLARCLGTEGFERLYEAVFDFDEFTPAAGAPDLFVWDSEAGIWFFAEVKGPHDHVRRSQADWVRAHWDNIKGRFVLLVVPPGA
jgi:hypothetical protein